MQVHNAFFACLPIKAKTAKRAIIVAPSCIKLFRNRCNFNGVVPKPQKVRVSTLQQRNWTWVGSIHELGWVVKLQLFVGWVGLG